MDGPLSMVEGFIVPVTSVSDAKSYVELAEKTGRAIYGWRIVPQKGKDPRVSVQQAVGFLKSKEYLRKNHTVFIDARKAFGDDCKKSNRFVAEMYDELQMHLGGPSRIGVLTTRQTWLEGMCNQRFDHVKLWYVNHNKKANFNDYTIFGNWKQPFAKQYDQVRYKADDGSAEFVYNVDYLV